MFGQIYDKLCSRASLMFSNNFNNCSNLFPMKFFDYRKVTESNK